MHLPGSAEDATNCAVVAEAAREAGFEIVHICSVDAMQVVVAGEERGIWAEAEPGQWQQFSFVFKLVPWEILAGDEPALTADLTQLLQSRDVVIANPAYALLFQSKGILAWLWQQYPSHPLLLETSMQELAGHYVSKPVLGREGQNVTEVNNNQPRLAVPGDFAHQPRVHQRYAKLPQDNQGRRYQAGVFWAGAACALGFRRANGFITNLSEFVPHILSD